MGLAALRGTHPLPIPPLKGEACLTRYTVIGAAHG